MELRSHVSNIRQVIIGHLKQAHSEIMAQIASFTDQDILEALCEKASNGVKVSVFLNVNEVNQGRGELNFQKLRNLGGEVNLLPVDRPYGRTTDHTVCVIDGDKVIMGSFNWSHTDGSNDENITVVTDSSEFAARYLSTFESLIRADQIVAMAADHEAALRRLELIRNLVLLGEQDDIAAHVIKLRPIADAIQISSIIASLDRGEYRLALEVIESYLRKSKALTVDGASDIPRLRLKLESLELRAESLTEEKTDLERRLILFNRRYYDALGNLVRRVLKARAELARLVSKARKDDDDREKAEATAKEAEDTYEDYAREHEELQRYESLPKLKDADEREIRRLYRKACSLCHPDKFLEKHKDAAHRAFVDLQDAYKANDLIRIREIQTALAAGALSEARSITLTEAEAMRPAIAELEYTIAKLVADLKGLQESEAARLVASAGITETDWQNFLARQSEVLEAELAWLHSESHFAPVESSEYL